MSSAIHVRFFGQLTDVTQTEELVLDNIADTDEVVKRLNDLYPLLQSKKYILAVNRKQVTSNTILDDQQIIALMPPFSGG